MQNIKIDIMWKTENTATVTVHDHKVSVKYHTDDQIRCLIPRVPQDEFSLLEALKSRCYPQNRSNIDYILKTMGLDGYDILGMCRRTHGLKRDDYIWLRFNDEPIQYENIKLRD